MVDARTCSTSGRICVPKPIRGMDSSAWGDGNWGRSVWEISGVALGEPWRSLKFSPRRSTCFSLGGTKQRFEGRPLTHKGLSSRVGRYPCSNPCFHGLGKYGWPKLFFGRSNRCQYCDYRFFLARSWMRRRRTGILLHAPSSASPFSGQ